MKQIEADSFPSYRRMESSRLGLDKRYRGSIDSRHVAAFSMICRSRKRHGYFVHTGITGQSSWENVDGPWITIISGERLLSLIDRDSDFRLEAV